MANNVYEYSDINRIKMPNTYMYTPLSGINFFDAYSDVRKKALAVLVNYKTDNLLKDVYSSFINENSLNLPDFIPNQDMVIKTKKVLEALLPAHAYGQNIYNWVDFFISRFEITKKLYDGYCFPSRKGTGSYETLELYASLAMVLGRICSYQNNLRYFNTLLKLNDLLCSLVQDLNEKSSVMVMYAILSEMNCSAKVLEKIKNADT